MKFTINQIEDKLRSIKETHPQISEFEFKAPVDAVQNEVSYPLFCAKYAPSNLSDKSVNVVIDMWVLDQVKHDRSNLTEVISDTLLILLDIRASLLDPDNAVNFRISQNINMIPFEEFTTDMLAGWYGSFTFEIMDLKDRCQIPN